MIREICFRTNSGKKIHMEEANNSGRSGEMWAGRQDLMVRGGGWGASKKRSSGGGGVDPCQPNCAALRRSSFLMQNTRGLQSYLQKVFFLQNEGFQKILPSWRHSLPPTLEVFNNQHYQIKSNQIKFSTIASLTYYIIYVLLQPGSCHCKEDKSICHSLLCLR